MITTIPVTTTTQPQTTTTAPATTTTGPGTTVLAATTTTTETFAVVLGKTQSQSLLPVTGSASVLVACLAMLLIAGGLATILIARRANLMT